MDLLKRIGNRLVLMLPSSGTLHGYENPELVDYLFRKDESYATEGVWEEMAGVSSVLDFGGGFGHHYRKALSASPDIKWAIVETAMIVSRARTIETDRLRFFTEIEDAARWLKQPDVIYSNSAIQYTDDPLRTLLALCSLRSRRMIWERVFLNDSPNRIEQISLLSQNGPGFIFSRKRVKTVITPITERAFLEAHSGYMLAHRLNNSFRFERKLTVSP